MTAIDTPQGTYQIARITYHVESATIPGLTYDVVVTERGTSCTCLAAQHGRRCWHRASVEAGQFTSKPTITIRPLPTRNPAAVLYED